MARARGARCERRSSEDTSLLDKQSVDDKWANRGVFVAIDDVAFDFTNALRIRVARAIVKDIIIVYSVRETQKHETRTRSSRTPGQRRA